MLYQAAVTAQAWFDLVCTFVSLRAERKSRILCMINKYSTTEIHAAQSGWQFEYFIYFEMSAHCVTLTVLELL